MFLPSYGAAVRVVAQVRFLRDLEGGFAAARSHSVLATFANALDEMAAVPNRLAFEISCHRLTCFTDQVAFNLDDELGCNGINKVALVEPHGGSLRYGLLTLA